MIELEEKRDVSITTIHEQLNVNDSRLSSILGIARRINTILVGTTVGTLGENDKLEGKSHGFLLDLEERLSEQEDVLEHTLRELEYMADRLDVTIRLKVGELKG